MSCLQDAGADGVAMVLLGNKMDCEEERQVPTEAGRRLAQVSTGTPLPTEADHSAAADWLWAQTQAVPAGSTLNTAWNWQIPTHSQPTCKTSSELKQF